MTKTYNFPGTTTLLELRKGGRKQAPLGEEGRKDRRGKTPKKSENPPVRMAFAGDTETDFRHLCRGVLESQTKRKTSIFFLVV